jgi:signal transduction histidine kinase/CheY-like chemotaxis protein
MAHLLITVAVANPGDVVTARQRARQIASLLRLETSAQTRFAASVSEIARNAVLYAGGGRVLFSVSDSVPSLLMAKVTDGGPGIAELAAVLEGRAAGQGIAGARRLVDSFGITSSPAGTEVMLGKRLPDGAIPSRADLARVAAALGGGPADNPASELEIQNRELVASLSELRLRQEELQRLNVELEDTNRGVVALYAELDERAEQLRQASDLKSRFLSNMSHEFRTPLNSILALARLLLDRVDGPLTAEQERQVSYIRRSAESLTELVNDLLDLAKVEAGKLELQARLFTIPELFGALRGVMKPLQQNEAVELIFDDPADAAELFTDEAKVAQVMRNLISNALKFTERGEVRVRAAFDGGLCRISVTDTGIGVAPENHELVFQEFSQVANRLQSRSKGTGLGLPLSRRLAELLGGSLTIASQVAQGAAFTLTFPMILPKTDETAPDVVPEPNSGGHVLIIDDEETSRYVLRQMLVGQPGPRIFEASTGAEGLRIAALERPDMILLDLRMPDMDGYQVLDRLGTDTRLRDIPVFVCTSSILGVPEQAELRHAAGVLSKASLTREMMARCLRSARSAPTQQRARVIGP